MLAHRIDREDYKDSKVTSKRNNHHVTILFTNRKYKNSSGVLCDNVVERNSRYKWNTSEVFSKSNS